MILPHVIYRAHDVKIMHAPSHYLAKFEKKKCMRPVGKCSAGQIFSSCRTEQRVGILSLPASRAVYAYNSTSTHTHHALKSRHHALKSRQIPTSQISRQNKRHGGCFKDASATVSWFSERTSSLPHRYINNSSTLQNVDIRWEYVEDMMEQRPARLHAETCYWGCAIEG